MAKQAKIVQTCVVCPAALPTLIFARSIFSPRPQKYSPDFCAGVDTNITAHRDIVVSRKCKQHKTVTDPVQDPKHSFLRTQHETSQRRHHGSSIMDEASHEGVNHGGCITCRTQFERLRIVSRFGGCNWRRHLGRHQGGGIKEEASGGHPGGGGGGII